MRAPTIKNYTRNQRLLAQISHNLAKKHLVMGAMGNISLRSRTTRCARVRGRDLDRREWAWIKRSGMWLERAKPGDFLRVNISHPGPKIAQKISKEINLHLGCYRNRPDINAVIHTHPFISTGLATIDPKIGLKLAKISLKKGLKTTLIRYYPPGSTALAKAVKSAVLKADVVLMANHGLVTVGNTLEGAYKRTLDIEAISKKVLTDSLISGIKI